MSSGISFTCDSCGREVFSCNIVNGMKFCAKCYQETFGNQKKYVDMLHKETGELLVNLLAEKDKQISELKAENERLKQHLKYNTKQVCEKIKKQIFNHFNVNNMEEYENLSLIDSLFTADAAIEMLDTILKEYQK